MGILDALDKSFAATQSFEAPLASSQSLKERLLMARTKQREANPEGEFTRHLRSKKT